MKRILVSSLALAALFAVDAQAQAGATRSLAASTATQAVRVTALEGKVTAPVELDVVMVEQGARERRVRIVARPTVDVQALTLEVAAEDGIALASTSQATWTGAARAGDEVVHPVNLVVSGNGPMRLVITATVKDQAGVSQTGHQEFALNPSALAATRAFGRRPGTAVHPGGRVIIEVPAARP